MVKGGGSSVVVHTPAFREQQHLCEQFCPSRALAAALLSCLQVCDADLLAEAAIHCSTTPECANQAFNINNGDTFRWSEVRLEGLSGADDASAGLSWGRWCNYLARSVGCHRCASMPVGTSAEPSSCA